MSSHISAIQTQLKKAGFYTGKVDGIAGPLTVEAVNKAIASGELAPERKQLVDEQAKNHPAYADDTDSPTLAEGGFSLSSNSQSKLVGVHDDLVKVVRTAISISKQDFMVVEGLRSTERQRELVRKGASRTMNSKHITGHAVDLAPVVDGKVSWDWQYYYDIAEAMRTSAKQHGVKIRWGGAWTLLNDTSDSAKKLVQSYINARKGLGKTPFTDGPHFEIIV